MPKVEVGRIDPKEREKLRRELRRSVERVNAQGELIAFMEHILTDSEQIMLTRRILIAHMLLQGETHRAIARKLRVGLSTVRSVDQWLQEFPEYRSVFPPLCEEKAMKDAVAAPSFRSLRKKYPLHFLLFNIMFDLEK